MVRHSRILMVALSIPVTLVMVAGCATPYLPSTPPEIPPTTTMPPPERNMVSITLAATNIEDGLRQLPQVIDGPTKETSLDGRPCRVMVSSGILTRYMYFNVQNDFIYAKTTNVVVTLDYFDAGAGSFALQYDSSDFTAEPLQGRFKTTEWVRLSNSGTWQTATFQLNDAYFGDRQHNTVSDFRIASSQDLAISRVTVALTTATTLIQFNLQLVANPSEGGSLVTAGVLILAVPFFS